VGQASHKDVPRAVETIWYSALKRRYEAIEAKHPKFAPKVSAAFQIGTLGGGNHFIELCLDTEQNVWIMLHSGSRGIGNKIGSYFISKAREEMERMFIHLPDKDLAYLAEGSQLFDDYVESVGWAQDYARLNREAMLKAVIGAMERTIATLFQLRSDLGADDAVAINCHHNYVERESHFGENVWVTRKGAVRARQGDLGIIPGSMGTRSYIVRGLGNAESFHSCSHGAGRRMSRNEAARTFTLDDHIAATAGVECRKDQGVIDETPGAYKNVDEVMAAQGDLVEIVATIKQVLCVKG
jgi:tRNA-splicing ligase RtcB